MVPDVYNHMRSIIFRTAAGLLAIAGDSGRVLAVDIQPEMLRILKQYLEQEGIRNEVC